MVVTQRVRSWLDEPEVVQARRRTLGTLVAAQVVGALGAGAGPSVGVLLAEEVTRSEVWAGVARASTTIGAALVALPLGMLAARHGRRRALASAWFAAGAGAVLLVVAAGAAARSDGTAVADGVSTALLVLGMAGLGAGSAAALQSRFAATDLAEPAHRARSLALVVWVGTAGAVVGPNLGVPGAAIERATGLPPFAGAFAIGAVLLSATGVVVAVLLRPDPLHVLARHAPDLDRPSGAPRLRLRGALAEIRRVPSARLALVALVVAHVAMVSVMTMTPVHLTHHGHGVTVVGLTISLHVLGMFAFAPVVGAVADRVGRVPTVVAGQVLLLVAAAVGAVGRDSTAAVVVALLVLGVGWSVVTVPASALLTQDVAAPARPLVQGVSDSGMNAAAAVGAIASGPVMAALGFGGLAAVTVALVVPAMAAVHVLRGRAPAPGPAV
ncbi:MFS transporter [Cellulomonas carbonis T26]|uniref:MFS transporter n=1 Tax=Cellulomonas carbonis T26 TaxID=947969 RepID=A0A0A0BJ26_9CELL|nr:MFS transporter [Cellulomonas carbonis T26]